MLVRAIKLGYYDHKRRYPAGEHKREKGDVFEIPDKPMSLKNPGMPLGFSKIWMEQVESPKAKPILATPCEETGQDSKPESTFKEKVDEFVEPKRPRGRPKKNP